MLDNIHTAQAEERGGGEQVAVVGMDFCEAVLGGGGEVEGVGGAEVGGSGGGGEDGFDPVNDCVGEWQEPDGAGGAIGAELGKDSPNRLWSGDALAEFAESYRIELGPAMQGAHDFIRSGDAAGDFG